MNRKSHNIQKQWLKRESLIRGKKNVMYKPLVNSEQIYLPPLHIKDRLMKNFVKAKDQNGIRFVYLNKNSQGKVMLKSRKTYL